MKKVAIITRTKDRPLLLRRAFESVSSQTYNDYVWVMVNDGGEKDSVIEIEKGAGSKGIDVKVIHNPKSLGMEAASNKGICSCESSFIIIHDDDDSWSRAFLEETVAFLESEEGEAYGGVVTQSIRIEEEIRGNKCEIIRKEPYNDWLSTVYIADMAKNNMFPPISFLYRREKYNELRGYNESLPVLGDWEFNLRFLLLSDIGVIRKALANYHLRSGSPSVEYGNTVIEGVRVHQKYDTLIRNSLLREDMLRNRIGLGYLVNVGKEIRDANDDINRNIDNKGIIRKIKKKLRDKKMGRLFLKMKNKGKCEE